MQSWLSTTLNWVLNQQNMGQDRKIQNQEQFIFHQMIMLGKSMERIDLSIQFRLSRKSRLESD